MGADEAEIDTRRLAAVTGAAPRPPGEWLKDFFAAAAIALVALSLFIIPGLIGRPVTETPEARIAVVAREMIQSGNYTTPTMGGEARLNKPPLPYWLTVAAAKVLDRGEGPTQEVMERAVKLPPALVSALAVFVVVLYGSLVFGRAGGMLAGLMLGFSLMLPDLVWKGYGDTTLMFSCVCMFCSAAWLATTDRPGIFAALALGVSLGLAILSKGHIPVLLLAAPLIGGALIDQTFNPRKFLLFIVALAVAVGIAGPWFFAVKSQGAWDVMGEEMRQAVVGGGHVQDDRWEYYIYRLAGGLLPWTPMVLIGWVLYLMRRSREDRANRDQNLARENWRFFSLAFVIGFAGFYAISKQQEHYLLPVLPALALATGYVLSRFKFPGGVPEEWLGWSQLVIGFVVGIAVITLPAWSLDSFTKSPATLEALASLRGATGWAVSVPLGLGILMLHFFTARQCAEGRTHVAGIAIAVMAFAALTVVSIYNSTHVDGRDMLSREAKRLQDEIKAADPARVYMHGSSPEIMVFYLQRRVYSLGDLETEPAGKTGEAAPQRVLIVTRKDFDAVSRVEQFAVAPPAANQQFATVLLDKNTDWPKNVNLLRKIKGPTR
jgi:4-amino-4-deoxy-L-arabinose transferase-like glycosyltransferase